MRPTPLITATLLLTAAAAFQFHRDSDKAPNASIRGISTTSCPMIALQPAMVCGVVQCDAGDGPHSISGSVSRDAALADGPVDLTLLRYDLRGDSHVVSAFVNWPLVGGTSFEVDGLTEGLWVVAARSVTEKSVGWGRSEPVWVTAEEPAGKVAVNVEPYGAEVKIEGIPEHLRHRARLTFEWTGSDRVLADGLEFLDPPSTRVHDGEHRDGFQLFGSLETVDDVWLVDAGVDPDVDPQEIPFDASVDPFGSSRDSWSWLSVCAEGFAAAAMTGPGHVRAILHAEPGLWEAQEIEVDVTRHEPASRAVIHVPFVEGSDETAGDLYGMHHPVRPSEAQ